MKTLTMLVGPPGSGKSTLAIEMANTTGAIYVNQDSQGPEGHLETFFTAIETEQDIIVDRMNFNKQQRAKYIGLAKLKGYSVKVIIKCESQETCLARMLVRENHPTIKNEKNARSAMQTFFTKYEPPEASEGIDIVERIYPPGLKPSAIVVDLDGTLCNVEHRRHFVRDIPEGQKKNWVGFFKGIAQDTINSWCAKLIFKFIDTHTIVFATGRDENHKQVTVDWLKQNLNMTLNGDYKLYMRHRNDSRQDYLVKEILLDFEILTRHNPLFMVDDRKQVVDMWRRRGFVCLHCDEGDF